jgi:hypothetical protein
MFVRRSSAALAAFFVALACSVPAYAQTPAPILVQRIDTNCLVTASAAKSSPNVWIAHQYNGSDTKTPWTKITMAQAQAILRNPAAHGDVARIYMQNNKVAWAQLISLHTSGRSFADYCFRLDGSLAQVKQYAVLGHHDVKLRQIVYLDDNGNVLQRQFAATDGDAALFVTTAKLPFYNTLTGQAP